MQFYTKHTLIMYHYYRIKYSKQYYNPKWQIWYDFHQHYLKKNPLNCWNWHLYYQGQSLVHDFYRNSKSYILEYYVGCLLSWQLKVFLRLITSFLGICQCWTKHRWILYYYYRIKCWKHYFYIGSGSDVTLYHCYLFFLSKILKLCKLKPTQSICVQINQYNLSFHMTVSL